jgi:hypothetical protein
MNDELERMWKEAVVAYFEVPPPPQLVGVTEENH